MTRATKAAVAKYGADKCRLAYLRHYQRGEGANTIAGYVLNDWDTRKGDALINAGREIVTGCR